jgi:hypothetical protein
LLTFVAFLTIIPNVGLSEDTEGETSQESVTHLNVRVRDLVNLVSFCIPNDNSLNNQFYYDRQQPAPFSIPEGFSFVVTDIIVTPNCAGDVPFEASFFTLAQVEGPLAVRFFLAQFSGQDVRHFTFTGGIAYPAGAVPRPRNTMSSSGPVELQLLGYFIRGTALTPGQPRF